MMRIIARRTKVTTVVVYRPKSRAKRLIQTNVLSTIDHLDKTSKRAASDRSPVPCAGTQIGIGFRGPARVHLG
jgi:hypothetical protein